MDQRFGSDMYLLNVAECMIHCRWCCEMYEYLIYLHHIEYKVQKLVFRCHVSLALFRDLSPSSAGKRPSARFPQHRRKKRKEMDEGLPESNQHKQNAYIIKLFDRSVDLAQFNTSTPLYPICRAWMRNNPSVRVLPASPSPPHIMVEEEPTDLINGKGQNVYRLPPPTSCPINTSGEPVNLRIPQTEKPTVNKLTDPLPVTGSLICDHMERWKKIRQKWKECSSKNQLRYSESIRVLKEMKELYDR
ncbi:protein lin-37 homolog isoform X2 [Anarrhichthys ocellatus]|uniref:protein lin-37 homolog isoform X2 n=1 Tax=Anarrhichthys ocellatus TaxID=433405 RepID=UPI0012ECF226|nr:protein lin-37 homolog isoform X2 [Anarrhichthys ocellatus]